MARIWVGGSALRRAPERAWQRRRTVLPAIATGATWRRALLHAQRGLDVPRPGAAVPARPRGAAGDARDLLHAQRRGRSPVAWCSGTARPHGAASEVHALVHAQWRGRSPQPDAAAPVRPSVTMPGNRRPVAFCCYPCLMKGCGYAIMVLAGASATGYATVQLLMWVGAGNYWSGCAGALVWGLVIVRFDRRSP